MSLGSHGLHLNMILYVLVSVFVPEYVSVFFIFFIFSCICICMMKIQMGARLDDIWTRVAVKYICICISDIFAFVFISVFAFVFV